MSEETSELELGANERMTARIADLERQLAEERARIDCSINNGWLSGDLECAGEDGPACWKHLLAEAKTEIKGLKELAYNYYDFTPNCGDDNKCLACGEQWYPNKCQTTCPAKLLFQAVKGVNSTSIVWLELCDHLETAQGKLEWVKRWTRGEGSKSELYRALSKEGNNATPRSN